MSNGDSVNIKTGIFGLTLTGPNALILAILIAIMGLTGLDIWENVERSREHDQIMCAIKLNLFFYTQPKGAPVEWNNMPVDLYNCIPKFLYERPVR
jgi:hypothetical protein